MGTDSPLVEMLTATGMSPKRAAAFERWLEDERPVGIGVAEFERALTMMVLKDCKRYVAALESQARVNYDLEMQLEHARSQRECRLF